MTEQTRTRRPVAWEQQLRSGSAGVMPGKDLVPYVPPPAERAGRQRAPWRRRLLTRVGVGLVLAVFLLAGVTGYRLGASGGVTAFLRAAVPALAAVVFAWVAWTVLAKAAHRRHCPGCPDH